MRKFGLKIAIFTILICALTLPVSAAQLLIPGGQVIGMQLSDDTVSVVAIDESLGAAAKSAGLQPGDRIVSLDGCKIRCSQDIRDALSKSDGKVDLQILRNGKHKTLTFCPTATEKGPKLGVYLKEGTSGIGTVTYYNPDNKTFGALGHGVNDPSGKLLNMKNGTIYDAAVLSVRKGKIGTPGQLMGTVTDSDSCGDLSKNTARGVFGKTVIPTAEPLPAATKGEVKTGAATIRSTIHGTAMQEYSVEILKIYPNTDTSGRNLLIKVTDPQLLQTTGGIVQGMSGSPIIQDGKLIGAVTHVLVNDPTTGYGIFIENMLDAAA